MTDSTAQTHCIHTGNTFAVRTRQIVTRIRALSIFNRHPRPGYHLTKELARDIGVDGPDPWPRVKIPDHPML